MIQILVYIKLNAKKKLLRYTSANFVSASSINYAVSNLHRIIFMKLSGQTIAEQLLKHEAEGFVRPLTEAE